MVEVYSTNVENHQQANFLLNQLSNIFPDYNMNFDLEDCDNILRVESDSIVIEVFQIVNLLNELGFIAQILPDNPSDINIKLEEEIVSK